MKRRMMGAVLAGAGLPSICQAATFTLLSAGGESAWSNPLSWSGGVGYPAQIDDIADCSATTLSGAVTLDVDVPVTVGSQKLGDAGKTYPSVLYPYVVQSTNNGSITFQSSSGAATLNNTTTYGNVQINTPLPPYTLIANVKLSSPLAVTVAANLTGYTLISSSIADTPGTGPHAISFSGPSTVFLTGSSSFSGSVSVSGGLALVSLNGLGNCSLVNNLGTVLLDARNTANGNVPIVMSEGTLFGGTADISANAQQFQSMTISNPIILNANATIGTYVTSPFFQAGNNHSLTATYTGSIQGSNTTLTLLGQRIVLDGPINLGTGDLSVQGATVQLASSSPVFRNLVVGDSGTMNVSSAVSFNALVCGNVGNFNLSGSSTFNFMQVSGGTVSVTDATFGSANLSGGNSTVQTSPSGSSKFSNAALTNSGNLSLFGTTTCGVLTNSGTGSILLGSGVAAVSVTNIGSGNIILAGTPNTNSITATAGSVILGIGGTIGDFPSNATISLSPGVKLIFNRSDSITEAALPISGSSSVTQGGSGLLTLTGNNNYSGGTFIQAGSLTLASAGAAGTGSITMSAGGTLIIGSDAVIASNALIFGGGVLRFNGYTSNLAFNNVPQFNIAATSGTIAVYAGAVTGSSKLAIVGPGALVLKGSDSFTGSTTIGGAAIVDLETTLSKTSGLSMASGELAGTGSSPSACSFSNCTVSPGPLDGVTPGVLTLGTSTFRSGTNLEEGLYPNGVSDMLAVLGPLNIFGNTTITFDYSTLTPGVGSYTLATYTVEDDGVFTTVKNLPPGYALVYGPTSLKLLSVPEPDVAMFVPAVAAMTALVQRRRRRVPRFPQNRDR